MILLHMNLSEYVQLMKAEISEFRATMLWKIAQYHHNDM
jgi:hypothetical protein